MITKANVASMFAQLTGGGRETSTKSASFPSFQTLLKQNTLTSTNVNETFQSKKGFTQTKGIKTEVTSSYKGKETNVESTRDRSMEVKDSKLEATNSKLDNSKLEAEKIKLENTSEDITELSSEEISAEEIGTEEIIKVDSATEELLEKVSKLLDEVKKIICNTLDISEEKLAEIMQFLGMPTIALLEPDSFKQIVLKNAETEDPMFLLMEETASDQLKVLYQSLDQLIEEAGFQKEELQTLISSSEFSNYLETIKGENNLNITNEEQIEDPIAMDVLNQDISLKEWVKTDVKSKNQEEIDNNMLESERTVKQEIEFTAVKLDEKGEMTGKDNSKENKSGSKEGALTPAQQFVETLANASAINRADFTSQMEQVNQTREIVNQIVEQIKVITRPLQTSFELQLNPEHLGKVNLSITSKEGVMTAQFSTQTQVAKEAIESQIQILRENLESQGIKVESIEVVLSHFGFEQNSGMEGGKGDQQNNQSRKRNFIVDPESEFNDVITSDALMSQLLGDSGKTIDYTA